MANSLLYRSLLFFLLYCISFPSFSQMGVEGAPITLSVSPRVCPTGQSVSLKGNILVNDKAQLYTINVTGPDGVAKKITGQTDMKGNFIKPFSETQTQGWYTAEVIAADNKGKSVDSFYVCTPQGVVNAYQNRVNVLLTNSIRNINQSLQYLEQIAPVNGLQENIEKLNTAIERIRTIKQHSIEANTHFTSLLSITQQLPAVQPAMQQHYEALSEWSAQADEVIPKMEQQQQYKNISSACEAINWVIELCGLVSWVMNFQGGIAKIFINIASDKVLPGAVDRAEWQGGDVEKESKKFAINEAQKGMTAACIGLNDALAASPTKPVAGWAGLAEFVRVGLVGDFIQYASKVLYAQKCVDLKGKANAQFTAKMYDKGLLYWSYGVDYKGTLTLRYEKNADLSQPVEVTGEFEGYKSKYTFWEKVENVEPIPATLKVIKRIIRSPAVINASAIGNDLGLAGRTLTPGMYRVKVKGKLSNNELVLEVVRSPFDLSEKVESNKLHLIIINTALPIPVIKTFAFPIAKARAAFVVGVGENYQLSLTQQNDKLRLQKIFINSKTMGSSGDIKLETKMDMSLSN